MKLSISRAADEFRHNLKTKAEKTRALVKNKRKPKITIPRPPRAASLSAVVSELQQIRELLSMPRFPGLAEFKITERDGNGKIKTFKVEEKVG